jgi:hypothetical protein
VSDAVSQARSLGEPGFSRGSCASAHRRSGYSSSSCVPAEPDSASPDTFRIAESRDFESSELDTLRGSYRADAVPSDPNLGQLDVPWTEITLPSSRHPICLRITILRSPHRPDHAGHVVRRQRSRESPGRCRLHPAVRGRVSAPVQSPERGTAGPRAGLTRSDVGCVPRVAMNDRLSARAALVLWTA